MAVGVLRRWWVCIGPVVSDPLSFLVPSLGLNQQPEQACFQGWRAVRGHVFPKTYRWESQYRVSSLRCKWELRYMIRRRSAPSRGLGSPRIMLLVGSQLIEACVFLLREPMSVFFLRIVLQEPAPGCWLKALERNLRGQSNAASLEVGRSSSLPPMRLGLQESSADL